MPQHFKKVWIDKQETPWLVTYYFDGRFWPGTLEEPPEYPELVIESITGPNGEDFSGMKSMTEIENYIYENHEDEHEEAHYYGED